MKLAEIPGLTPLNSVLVELSLQPAAACSFVYFVLPSDPILPTIDGPASESVSWTLNDTEKTIQCTARGDPVPKLTWIKNGKVTHKTKPTVRKYIIITYITYTVNNGQ
jgi:hypothetical protein